MTAKAIADVLDDPELWDAYGRILRPILTRQLTRAFRTGFLVAQIEMAKLGRKAVPFAAKADPEADDAVNQAINAFMSGALNTAGDDVEDYVARHYSNPFWARWSASQQDVLRRAIAAARVGNFVDAGIAPHEAAAWAKLSPFGRVAQSIESAFAPGRARLIAATEVTNVLGAGALASYRQAGFTAWEWRTSADRRVCPVCEARDGEVYDVRQPFSAAHPACRCWPVPDPYSLKLDAPPPPPPPPPSAADYPPGFPADRMRLGRPFPPEGFKTWKAADVWFGERYPWITFRYFQGAAMPALNANLRNFDLLAGEFPWVAARFKHFGNKAVIGARFGARVYAHAVYDGRGIGFNPRYYTTRGAEANRLAEMLAGDSTPSAARPIPWHPRGNTDIGSVGVHEFGHAVDGFLGGSHQSGRRLVPATATEPAHYVRFHEPALAGSYVNDVYRKLRSTRTDISEYGQRKPEEGFAEAFAQWFSAKHRLPGALPLDQISPHAKAVGELMEAVPPAAWNPLHVPHPKPARPSPEIEQLNDRIAQLMNEADTKKNFRVD